MSETVRINAEQRVLLLASTRKDAVLTESVLGRAGVTCVACSSLAHVCDELEAGAGALLLAEEVVQSGERSLVEWLNRQPSWSDLPVLILARQGANSASVAEAMEVLGNVTVLERPTRLAALVSAVRAALRSRSKQYEARAHLVRISRSESDLRDFFDNAAIGLHWVGSDGIILRVNQTELDMLGYSGEEYVGRHIAEFHVDPPVIENILACLTRGETLREFAARLRCKDGSIKHVLINSNVLWEDGRFIHTRCFTRDISDRKEAEEAQARLAAIVASSDDAIISMTSDGIILTWNSGAERHFGYKPEETIGRPITMLIPPDRIAEESTFLERLRRGEHIEHFETVRVSKGGQRLDVSLTVSPIRDAENRIVGASKVARDIGQSKRAAEALRAAQEQLQIVTDNMAAVVTRCSRDMRYLWVSPGCAAWLKRNPADLIGKPIQDIVGREAMAMIRPYIERVLAGEIVEYEVQVPYRGIGLRWVKVVYSPTLDPNGQPDGWVAVIIDTSVHHQLQEALRDADRRKDEFLAVLAHELRNPLAPIRNSLRILTSSARQDPAVGRVAAMMERQVNHMVRLVDDLMEVSRITRGKIELRKERVDVAPIVRGAVETSRPLIETAGHQLDISIPDEPIIVDGDAVRLSQAITNLLNNSAKYTEAGGHIWLTVRHEQDAVEISVRDTGVGIPKEMLPRVFDLFTQIDRHADRAQGGLGIGLTLVKSLVEMHGGTVTAQSKGVGHGSEFTIRLPLAKVGSLVKLPLKQDTPSTVLSPRRVLVVDDNQDAADSLGMILSMLGVEVHIVYNGIDAIEAFSTYKPAIVVMDIGMPGMDGHEVARQIRRQPESQNATLVALTGWSQEEDRNRSQAAGFDHHLVKPADFGELEALLVSLDQH